MGLPVGLPEGLRAGLPEGLRAGLAAVWVNVLLAMAPQPLSTEFVRDRPAELGTQSTDLQPYSTCWLFVRGLAVLTFDNEWRELSLCASSCCTIRITCGS